MLQRVSLESLKKAALYGAVLSATGCSVLYYLIQRKCMCGYVQVWQYICVCTSVALLIVMCIFINRQIRHFSILPAVNKDSQTAPVGM